MKEMVSGFSKKTKAEKAQWVAETFASDPAQTLEVFKTYNHSNPSVQELHDEFIENTLANYYLPFAIAPNFLIDQKVYAIPMVIEESSVVAAASKAAKFWADKGGFHTQIVGTEKVGHVHLNYFGPAEKLFAFFEQHRAAFETALKPLSASMEKRGGGIRSLQLVDNTHKLEGYYHIALNFETRDAMGANFINSCLEQLAQDFSTRANEAFLADEAPEVVMSILSNYVPNCTVRAWVSCPIDQLAYEGVDGHTFAKKFCRAVAIAQAEPYRAVTHNKGIMNGIDAVVIASGNDFRAVEAGVHAYASRDGQYRSLTKAFITDTQELHFELEVPLALGTVGGLTGLHPLVKQALDILGQPSAEDLMRITSVAGLAQNFAAVSSLVTTGIQKGHMKMHLLNLLNAEGASSAEKETLVVYFSDKTVSSAAVKQALNQLRK
ncbi:MAG: hydroxymethylglutaryl-CoA reductase, degradative [Flavobacteriaceae bacterium]